MVLEVLCESRKCSKVNCDNYFVINNDGFFLGAVADGVGKYSEIASQNAVSLVRSFCDKSVDEIIRLAALEFQKLKLEEDTTLAVSVIKDNRLFLRYVGDSYAFLIRDGIIYQLNKEQNARNLLEVFFNKHPRGISLDDIVGLFNDKKDLGGYLLGGFVEVGGDLYNSFKDDSKSVGLLGLSDEIAFIKKYFKDEFDEDEFSKLDKSDKRKLIITFINLVYKLWNRPIVMNNFYWCSMYSTLKECCVGSFSREVGSLVNSDDSIDLKSNDVVVLASDGVIKNISLRLRDNNLVRDWDYRNVLRDKAKQKLKELLVGDFNDCKRAIAPPITNGDDATIIVVKYSKNILKNSKI